MIGALSGIINCIMSYEKLQVLCGNIRIGVNMWVGVNNSVQYAFH